MKGFLKLQSLQLLFAKVICNCNDYILNVTKTSLVCGSYKLGLMAQ